MNPKTKLALCKLLGLDATQVSDEQVEAALQARQDSEGGGLFVQELGRDGSRHVVRFTIDLSKYAKGADGKLPAELHIIPDGPRVFARDGRRFKISDPQSVIRASETPALVDWEHMSELPSFWGGSSKAAAWISGYSYVEGKGVVANVEKWTADGARDVQDGTYRYLSPVLYIDGETEEVTQIVSVALTNTPALRLESIEQFQRAFSRGSHAFRPSPSRTSPEDSDMNPKLKKQLCAMLGLDADKVTDEQFATALEAYNAKQAGAANANAPANIIAETASVSHEVVSTVAYQAVVAERNEFAARLEKAEKAVAEQTQAAFCKNVEDAFAKAAASGHVTPAEREFELARISTQDDLDKAVTAWSKRPPLAAPPAPSTFSNAANAANKASAPTTAPGAFSKDQEAFLKRTGLTPEQFATADAGRRRTSTQET